MKKTPIEQLPVVKAFSNYIVARAKRVLGLKNADFDHPSIDVHPERRTIWVWFHGKDKVVARAQFYFNGQCYHKLDCRLEDD